MSLYDCFTIGKAQITVTNCEYDEATCGDVQTKTVLGEYDYYCCNRSQRYSHNEKSKYDVDIEEHIMIRQPVPLTKGVSAIVELFDVDGNSCGKYKLYDFKRHKVMMIDNTELYLSDVNG